MPYSLLEISRSENAVFYVVLNNENNFLEQIKGTYPSDYSKLVRYFERFLEYGKLFDETKFKFIANNIFEFKTGKIRVLCLMLHNANPKTIILLHYHKKQKRKSPQQDVNKAIRISGQIIQEIKSGKINLG